MGEVDANFDGSLACQKYFFCVYFSVGALPPASETSETVKRKIDCEIVSDHLRSLAFNAQAVKKLIISLQLLCSCCFISNIYINVGERVDA